MRCFRMFADNANRLNQLNMLYASVYLKSVGIYDSSMATYRSEIKTRFAFFDEVFHPSSFAVKFYEILC